MAGPEQTVHPGLGDAVHSSQPGLASQPGLVEVGALTWLVAAQI